MNRMAPIVPPSPPMPGLVPALPVRPRHYLWIVGAVLVLVAALRWLGPVLTPFLVGAILAYLGTPIVRRCEGWGLPARPAPCSPAR